MAEVDRALQDVWRPGRPLPFTAFHETVRHEHSDSVCGVEAFDGGLAHVLLIRDLSGPSVCFLFVPGASAAECPSGLAWDQAAEAWRRLTAEWPGMTRGAATSRVPKSGPPDRPGRLLAPGDNTPVTKPQGARPMRRSFARYLVLAIAAMLAVPKVVWDGTKWVLRAAFAPPTPQGMEIEEAFADVAHAAAPTPSPAPDTVQAEDTVHVAKPFVSRTPSETEESLVAWGRTARAYATSRLSTEPEPDMKPLDESAEGWLRALSDEECRRLLDFSCRRVSDHMTGSHLISGLPRCLVRPAWMPAIELASVDGDELYESVKADIARDPDSVPGYRVAA